MTNPANALRRPKGLLIALMLLAVAAVVVVGLLATGDDKPEAINNIDPGPSASPSAAPTTPSATPTDKDEDEGEGEGTDNDEVVEPRSSRKCIGPNEQFNVAGDDVDTLRPDCGTTIVPSTSKKPLGLACGGKYPTIMYKTTTDRSKATVCGTNSSGEDLRMVTKAGDSTPLDLKAEYAPSLDAFVAEKDGVTYTIEAYNGSLTVTKDGSKDRQDSRDWISLDNESDYD